MFAGIGRRGGVAVGAAVAAAAALVGIGAVPASASDTGSCAANGQTSSHGAEYVCGLWKGNVPVYEWTFTNTRIVGYLNVGGRANWFVGQCQAVNDDGSPAEVYVNGYYNSHWAFTEADNGVWGWVPETYFAGGSNDQASGVLPSSC
ncbi:MAG TPA: hypothetical protein VGL02_08320 [Streptomyces sp.]